MIIVLICDLHALGFKLLDLCINYYYNCYTYTFSSAKMVKINKFI
jgi:hypothetical protein